MSRKEKLSFVGLSFHESSLEGRVKALQCLPDLKSRHLESLGEYIILDTCNRVEIIYFDEKDPDTIKNSWSELCGERASFVVYRDFEVVRHLFRVASSLESMVVGETQITGQVKSAYEKAAENKTVGTVLHKLFQRAFRVAKKVKANTEVGRFPVSVPSIAVKLAERVVGSFSKRTIGIVGLGEMGRLAAEYFSSAQPDRLLLCNRSEPKAIDLAEKFRAENVRAEVSDLENLLKESDIVVSATSGELCLVSATIECLSKRIFIDLSVPPSMSGVRALDHYYFGIDDLEKISRENQAFRQSELEKAENIIHYETDRFWNALRAFLFHDLFENLEVKMAGIRREELKALRSRLSDLRDSDWMEIEKMAERMVNRVLQEPMKTVKSQLEAGESRDHEGLISFFRHLFKV